MAEPIFSIAMRVARIEPGRIELQGGALPDDTVVMSLLPDLITSARMWLNYSGTPGDIWPQKKADKLAQVFDVDILEGEEKPRGRSALPAHVMINDAENPGEGGRLGFHADIGGGGSGLVQLEVMLMFSLDAPMQAFPVSPAEMAERQYWISIRQVRFDVDDHGSITPTRRGG